MSARFALPARPTPLVLGPVSTWGAILRSGLGLVERHTATLAALAPTTRECSPLAGVGSTEPYVRWARRGPGNAAELEQMVVRSREALVRAGGLPPESAGGRGRCKLSNRTLAWEAQRGQRARHGWQRRLATGLRRVAWRRLVGRPSVVARFAPRRFEDAPYRRACSYRLPDDRCVKDGRRTASGHTEVRSRLAQMYPPEE